MPAPEREDNLVEISALDFTVGMFVATELYVKLNGNLVLLCNNSTLSKDLVDKINDFELTGSSLYIDKDYFNTMRRHHKLDSKPGINRLSRQYQSIKSDASNIFDKIEQSEQIPWDNTNQIAARITSQARVTPAPYILQFISAIRSTDEYLYTHCVNVSMLNALIGKWLGKDERQIDMLINIGLLHDVGKLRVPNAILNKPGRLSREEFEIIKKHPIYSQEILEKSGVTDRVLLSSVRAHHEQMNGQGYPDHLSADKIPEFARITAISDIYDAMVARRVYKEPASPFAVLEQFSRDRFSHLDIQIVNVFLTQMSIDLAGKRVMLCTGEVAEVLYVDKGNFAHPIVRLGEKTFRTNDNIYCTNIVE